MSTVPISKTKITQLTQLLTQKFKQKFKIHPIREAELLAQVQAEIEKLLTSGKAYEKNLVKLERELET